MKKQIGGMRVKAGYFWNMRAWELTVLSGEGGVLPGGVEDRYLRVPMAALLILGPLMGAAFVMFLPLIGFWLLFHHLAERGLGAVRRLIRGTAAAAAAGSDGGRVAVRPGSPRDGSRT